eukprot:gene3446-3942_t
MYCKFVLVTREQFLHEQQQQHYKLRKSGRDSCGGSINDNSSDFSVTFWLLFERTERARIHHRKGDPVPFFDTATAWTMTNVIHNVGNYVLLHHVKGAPFQTFDQGQSRKLTHWEQIDHGEMYTMTRKFLTLVYFGKLLLKLQQLAFYAEFFNTCTGSHTKIATVL